MKCFWNEILFSWKTHRFRSMDQVKQKKSCQYILIFGLEQVHMILRFFWIIYNTRSDKFSWIIFEPFFFSSTFFSNIEWKKGIIIFPAHFSFMLLRGCTIINSWIPVVLSWLMGLKCLRTLVWYPQSLILVFITKHQTRLESFILSGSVNV